VPGKRAARPAKQDARRRWLLGLVALLVVLALAGTVTFALTRSASGGGTTPSTPAAGHSATPGQQPTSGGQASPTPQSTGAAANPRLLRACAAEVTRAGVVVAAAARGVDDWSDHVQARTDMLAGHISVETMDSIWRRTRIAGPADQSRFRAARDSFDSTSHCARLRNGSGSPSGPTAGCLARSRAAEHAVAAADAAMRDWKSHLANMAMYAHGEMSSMTAQAKWVSAWRNAPPHIKAYRTARAALDEAPACKVRG
jgi:hypothetical protein